MGSFSFIWHKIWYSRRTVFFQFLAVSIFSNKFQCCSKDFTKNILCMNFYFLGYSLQNLWNSKNKNINSRSSFNKLTYYWSVINESLDRTDNFANIAERVTSEMPKVAYEMLEFNIPPESWRNLKNEVELYSIFDYY